MRSPRARSGLAITVAAVTLIALATLTPQQGPFARAPVWCLLCGEYGLQDFVLNVLFFVPFGVGLRLLSRSRWRPLLVVIATTVLIEAMQLDLIPGRESTLGDVVANALGGLLGVLLVTHWSGLSRPSPRSAAALAVGGAMVWIALLAGTAWAFQADAPKLRYYGQLAPALGHLDHFTGLIARAELDGAPVEIGRLNDESGVRARLMRNAITIAAATTPGDPTRRVAPIVSVFDEARHEIVLLGRLRDDAIFRARTRAQRFGLRTPALRLVDVFPAAGPTTRPETLRVRGTRSGAQYELSLERASGASHVAVSLRTTMGWMLVYPGNTYLGELDPWAGIAFLAVPLLLLGYWSGRAAPSTSTGAITLRQVLCVGVAHVALCAIALHFVPGWFALPSARWWEWTTALAALVLGTAAGIATGIATGIASQSG